MKTLLKKYYSSHKETLINFIWRSLQIIGKQGPTFFVFIFCAKLLTPYNFGIYNYVLSIIFLLIMFGDFGISTATSKYVAKYNVTNKNKLKLVLFNSGSIVLALTTLSTILILIIGPWYLKEKYIYILYLLPLIFLTPMTSLYDGIYRGLKRFKQLAIISLIVGLFFLVLAYFLINTYGLIGALISQNILYFILLICLGFGYKEFSFRWNGGVLKEIGSYSFAFGLALIGSYLFSRVGVLILGHFNYVNEIAVYELLNKILLFLLIPFSILGSIVSPNFTVHYAKKNYKLILSKFKKYFLIFLCSSIIFAILSYLFLPLIFSTFFKEYHNSVFSVMLIPVILIYALQVYCTTIHVGIIVATGHASLFSYPNLIAGLFNILLSIVLLRYFGFIGVIYSTLIVQFMIIVFTDIVYYLKLNKLANL